MWYGVAADIVVGIHVAYVAYVVLGHLAVCAAAAFKREWGRNPWFRFSHLLAIAIVAYEEIRGIRCPLTVWEEQLRGLAGQGFDGSQTFMGRLMHDLLFYENKPEIFFTTLHLAAFALIVQALVMYPPRFFRFGGPDRGVSQA
ncbi:MAG: DUF2784 domain-containing protein [Gemmataceae bacterium]|nr:DUF2784 domain-containing protein [Gemmataceae bacterium]